MIRFLIAFFLVLGLSALALVGGHLISSGLRLISIEVDASFAATIVIVFFVIFESSGRATRLLKEKGLPKLRLDEEGS